MGRLARWLRLLGHDAAWESGDDVERALTRARRENRILLTRSRKPVRLGLSLPPAGGRVIRSEGLIPQLVEVAQSWPIFRDALPFSRCPECNEPLEPIAREHVEGRVPPFVAKTQQAFRACPSCDRIYWNATHSRGISGAFEEAARLAGQSLPVDGLEEMSAGSDLSDPAPDG